MFPWNAHRIVLHIFAFSFLSIARPAIADDKLSLRLDGQPGSLMEADPGFTGWNFGITAGAGFGTRALGSSRPHDLAIASVHVGRLARSETPFFRHFELAAELWSGVQMNPRSAYLVGFTPTVRYHFLPFSAFDPFIDAGVGVTGTDIGRPDLSTTFQFNIHGGPGFHWRLHPDLAFTFQARYVHLSNARIHTPNLGVNSFVFSGGITWFF